MNIGRIFEHRSSKNNAPGRLGGEPGQARHHDRVHLVRTLDLDVAVPADLPISGVDLGLDGLARRVEIWLMI